MSLFDTNVGSQQNSLFGAIPANQQTQTQSQNTLGFGLDISDLSPVDRYRNLQRYAGDYMELMGDTTYRQELKAAREAADAVTGAAGSSLGVLQNGLSQLGVFAETPVEETAANIDRFRGSFEDYIYGPTPDERPFGIGGVARALTLGPESANRSAALQQLVNQEALDAREQLEGQGQVSNYEGQLLASAQNTIGTRGTSPEDIARQVHYMRDSLDAAQFRNRENIRFDELGREWEFDRETGKPVQRVITIPDPQTGTFVSHPISDPNMEVVAVTTRNLAEDDFLKQYYNAGISEGTWILYNGQSFQKGAENDPYRSR